MSDILWAVKGECWERLESDTGEAIGRYLDDLTVDEMPETITLVEYKRNEATEEDVARLADYAATWFVEYLDEDERLGSDPDAPCTRPTERHKAAARVFVRAVLDDWTPFYCSPTGHEEEINVREWLQENEPWRLKEGEGEARNH